MTWLFYFFVSLFLLVLQTSILPWLPVFNQIYDLLIPFILYICVYKTAREAIITLVFLGIVMDNLSGSPMGLYLSTYFVFYVCVLWIVSFLNISNKLLISLIVAFGVGLENLLHWFAVFVSGAQEGVLIKQFETAFDQILWAICTGPFIIMAVRSLQDRWDILAGKLFPKESVE